MKNKERNKIQLNITNVFVLYLLFYFLLLVCIPFKVNTIFYALLNANNANKSVKSITQELYL